MSQRAVSHTCKHAACHTAAEARLVVLPVEHVHRLELARLRRARDDIKLSIERGGHGRGCGCTLAAGAVRGLRRGGSGGGR